MFALPDENRVERMSLHAIDNVPIGFEQQNELLGFPVPTENVATVRSGQNEIRAPPGRLFDHGSSIPVSGELFNSIWLNYNL
jgi:hypothetical protein